MLHQEPKRPEGLPAELERIVLRCLRKDPAKRFQHMDDVCVALEELQEESDSGKLGAAATAAPRPSLERKLAYAAAVVGVLAAATALAWQWMSPPANQRAPSKLVPLTAFSGFERSPSFSPDGRQVAFLHQRPDLYWDLRIISLSDPRETAPLIHPAFKNAWMPPFAWTRDSRELVGPFFYEDWESRLWRIPADGQAPPVPVAGATGGATDVAIAPQGGYLAYASSVQDSNIWRLEVNAGQSSAAPVKLIASTSWDGTPEYSPDGRRILFGSTRSGYTEVWVCDSDGSNATRLTHIGGPETGSGRWSPDGRTLYYVKDIEAAGLWKMPMAGGEEVQVLDVPEPRRWGAVAYTGSGVYDIAREAAARRAAGAASSTATDAGRAAD